MTGMEVMDSPPISDLPSQSSSSTHPSSFDPWWLIFVIISILGIIFNCLTFIKSKTTRKQGLSANSVSLSLLCVMAGADTACLVAFLFMLSMRYMGIANTMFLRYTCKVQLFVIHSASAFSIYCWLVLSLVRYVAVFCPFKHLRIHKQPHQAVFLLALVICLLQSWLLYDVDYNREFRACMSELEPNVERKIQIAEIIFSYFIPLVVITICDVKVVYFRNNFSRDSSLVGVSRIDGGRLSTFRSLDRCSVQHEESVFMPNGTLRVHAITKNGTTEYGCSLRSRRVQLQALQRILLISIFDLLLNLPNYMYRLYLNIFDIELSFTSQEVLYWVENISQMLYFAQFSLNAFYLACLIYDSPKKKHQHITHIENMYFPSKT